VEGGEERKKSRKKNKEAQHRHSLGRNDANLPALIPRAAPP